MHIAGSDDMTTAQYERAKTLAGREVSIMLKALRENMRALKEHGRRTLLGFEGVLQTLDNTRASENPRYALICFSCGCGGVFRMPAFLLSRGPLLCLVQSLSVCGLVC